MRLVIPGNSLLSSIAAVHLSNIENIELSLKKDDLKHHDRFYSINEFSKRYLDHVGIWKNLDTDKIVSYNEIDIYLKKDKTINFNCCDLNTENLGYIVSEKDLLTAVKTELNSCKLIDEFINLDTQSSNKDLIIYTDIKDVLANKISVKYSSTDYKQIALNINLSHQNDNMRKPRQIFYDQEILGLLPLDNYTYNLIWSLPSDMHGKLMNNSSDELSACLSDRIEFIVGDIKKISIGKSFPLSSRHTDTYFYDNNLFVGEAAHKYHPLAGLGLNMGIEDVAYLSYLMVNHKDKKSVMYNFSNKRIARNHGLQKILDLIINFHSTKLFPLEFKNRALKIFNQSIYLKAKITKNATGLIDNNLINQ